MGRFGSVLTFIIAVAALILAGWPYLEGKPQPTDEKPPQFTIEGSAQVRAPAEKVSFTIRVEERAPELDAAQAAALKRFVQIAREIKQLDAQNISIEFGRPDFQPFYKVLENRDGEFEEVDAEANIAGYIATYSARIELRDLTVYPIALSRILDARINEVGFSEFSVKDERELRLRAYTEAVADAREKATAYLKDSGQRLGQIVFMKPDVSAGDDKIVVTGARIRRDEFSDASPIQVIDGEIAREVGLTGVAEMIEEGRDVAFEAPLIELDAEVTVTFEIIPE